MSTAASSWRHFLVILSGFEAFAVALWLVPASMYVVRWPASGPARVAHVASMTTAIVLVVSAGVAAGLVISWSRQGHDPARVASIVAPLSLLWLWAVPYLPWLPDRLPLLLMLSGPLRWLIAGAAASAALWRLAPGAILGLRGGIETHARTFVFVTSLSLCVGFGWMNARALGPGGDEPHYLIIAQSILRDGDLKIENNHQRRDYEAYFSGELRP